jgi:hypothetical protein
VRDRFRRIEMIEVKGLKAVVKFRGERMELWGFRKLFTEEGRGDSGLIRKEFVTEVKACGYPTPFRREKPSKSFSRVRIFWRWGKREESSHMSRVEEA